MSFDREVLAARIAAHGPVARVVLADVRGSSPREAGASMVVWAEGQDGTIGGGALEWEAAERARAALETGRDRVDSMPLGPALGQCCGGHVTVLTEIWNEERLAEIEGELVARPLPGRAAAMPMAVRRVLREARASGMAPCPGITAGWCVEPVTRPGRAIWIHGAGHVGRALARVLAPLPDLQVTLIDTARSRFPDELPEGVLPLVAANPAEAVAHAPGHAEHFVLTYSHALDLEICHRVLGRPFRSLGLIGSATKRARFRRRLMELGHGPEQVVRMRCPIGDPALGKHPQAIAVSVAAEVLEAEMAAEMRGRETR